MKLKRVQTLPSAKLTGRVPGDLYEALAAYGRYYRDVHGEAIETWPLMVQILRTFVEEDRAFQMWRRRSNGAAAGAQSEPRNGSGTESRSG